jgi:hypothetical protein
MNQRFIPLECPAIAHFGIASYKESIGYHVPWRSLLISVPVGGEFKQR